MLDKNPYIKTGDDSHLEITELQVLKSNAGYYVGRYCNEGPYSRNSDYFKTRQQAQDELDEHNAIENDSIQDPDYE